MCQLKFNVIYVISHSSSNLTDFCFLMRLILKPLHSHCIYDLDVTMFFCILTFEPLSILYTSRPSITRISGDAKDHKKELWNSQDSLKAVTLPETIQERSIPESPTIIHPKNEKETVSHSQIASSPFLRDDNKIPNFTPPQIEEKDNRSNSSLSTTGESDANDVSMAANMRILG